MLKLFASTFPDLVVAFWVIFITELIPAFHTLHETHCPHKIPKENKARLALKQVPLGHAPTHFA